MEFRSDHTVKKDWNCRNNAFRMATESKGRESEVSVPTIVNEGSKSDPSQEKEILPGRISAISSRSTP
jgi:hypothetical protein